MRAGVDDAVRGESVGQVHVSPRIAEAKLQYCHAGNVETFTQRMHVGSDVAEIFGKER